MMQQQPTLAAFADERTVRIDHSYCKQLPSAKQRNATASATTSTNKKTQTQHKQQQQMSAAMAALTSMPTSDTKLLLDRLVKERLSQLFDADPMKTKSSSSCTNGAMPPPPPLVDVGIELTPGEINTKLPTLSYDE